MNINSKNKRVCSKYCIYHVQFKVCLIPKPLVDVIYVEYSFLQIYENVYENNYSVFA